MLQLEHVAHIVETSYDIQIAQIEALPPIFDWRGLFRIQDTQGQTWILRLLAAPTAFDAFSKIARLLQWLEQLNYPAPRLARTRDQQPVSVHQGWSGLLVSYIPGVLLDAHSADWAAFGYTLGRLHTLASPSAKQVGRSRCDPRALQSETARQLATAIDRVDPTHQLLIAALHTTVTELDAPTASLCLTHGDCWYKNAIQTADGTVALIDWDCAGIGVPVLDLGNLLLTAHYDLDRPLHVTADAAKIEAIMAGYQSMRPLTAAERARLPSAVAWLLAFQVGEYIMEQPLIVSDDLFLQKVQVRLAASSEIAQLASSM